MTKDVILEAAAEEQTIKLGEMFDIIIKKNYGNYIAPEPIVTPFGIGPLDSLLGGGLISSGPVMFTSTPETGKSTTAFQFSAAFQKTYPNSIIVYIDIEGSGNVAKSEFRVSRIESFGLDLSRFKYEPILLDVMSVFQLIEALVDIKKKAEEKTGKEFYVAFIWDSVAATPSSKTAEADNPNNIIGLKARQLSFCLEKYTPLLKFNKITFIIIDQVRANISMEGPYAQKEKSVGNFKDMKAASNIYALQHNVQQWMFISKKKNITAADGMGMDGWFVDIFMEKNKLAPGQHWITCVFDKNHGLDKFWSEFTFLSQPTPGEAKIYKNKNLPFPLCVKQSGPQYFLQVVDPNNPSNVYTSEKFYKKNAKKKYESDESFRQWFDFAVTISTHYRIINGLFMIKPVDPDCVCEDKSEETNFDPETGEVFENEQPNTSDIEPEFESVDDEQGMYQSAF